MNTEINFEEYFLDDKNQSHPFLNEYSSDEETIMYTKNVEDNFISDIEQNEIDIILQY